VATGPETKRPATYDDLLQVPDNLVAEIVDGELYATPRPAPPHALAASALGFELGPPFHGGRGGPGGWWILFEPELHHSGHVLVPDLAGWRRERMPVLPETQKFTVPPDWICEVLSRSTEQLDRARKLPIYARAGVEFAWLLNPLSRTLEILQREGARWVLLATHAHDEMVRAAPFDAITVDLLALWGELRQSPGP